MPYGQPADEPIPRIPLVVPLESRRGTLRQDAQLFNAYAEKDEEGEYNVYSRQGIGQIYKIPNIVPPVYPAGQYSSFVPSINPSVITNTFFIAGIGNLFVTSNDPGPGPITSVDNVTYPWPSQLWQVSAVTAPYTGNPENICFIHPGSSNIYNFNQAPGGISIQPYPWIATFGGGAPISCPGMVFLDGTTYFMDVLGYIWGSQLGNTAALWTAAPNLSNFIQANEVQGQGVALNSHKSLVVALKTSSIEFFFDNANPVGSPLLAVPNSTIQIGCVDGFTVQNIEDKLIWLATSKQSGYFIAMLNNRQQTEISTPGVNKILDKATGPFFSFSMRDTGHTFYGITAIGTNVTLVYDLSQNLWYVWTDQNGNYWPWMGMISSLSDYVYCQSLNSAIGNYIYAWDDRFTTDNGVIVPAEIYTPNYDSGSRRIDVCQRMDIIADQVPGYLQIRHSHNDFKSWSRWRQVNLNQDRPTLLDCGSFRRRAWHFKWNTGRPLRLQAVELTIIPGTA